MNYESLDLVKLRKDNEGKFGKEKRSHQIDSFVALSKTYNFPMEGYKGGLLVLPTGAGKTFTAVRWICENILSKNIKVLWLAQSSYLLDQACNTFLENVVSIPPSRDTLNVRVVSSDPAHSNSSDIETTDDVLIMTTQTAISKFNNVPEDINGEKVDSYFKRFINSCKDTQIFVVLDEAHHAPAYGCRNLLIDIKEMIPNLYLLGLTATPTYSDKKNSGWLFKIFDKGILYEAKTTKLIAENILALPVYIEKSTGRELEVDDKLYNRLVREHKDLPGEIVEKLAHDSARNDYIVNEYVSNKSKYGKTIIFADRWFQCEYLKSKLNEKGINCEAIYSQIDAKANTPEERNKRSTTENQKIMKEFREGKYEVLINVKMMTEGVDIPDVKTVFLTRQTTSAILMTQMIGRALRGEKSGGGKGKSEANIVLFLDNWKRIINWANPIGDGTSNTKPIVRGAYPKEYISISLIEQLSKQINSGVRFADSPYLTYIPTGWYQTEYTVSITDDEQEEMETYSEFVMVFDSNKNKFEIFIDKSLNNIPDKFADEKIEDEQILTWLDKEIEEYFDLTQDDIGGKLKNELVKISRHLAQNGEAPIYHSFDERNDYNLDEVAMQLMYKDAISKYTVLQNEFNKNGSLWKVFYRDYNRFKSAYDAVENRLVDIKINGPIKPEPPINEEIFTDSNREPTKVIKEQVLRRDGYKCVCCGREKGKGVTLEVDHILPFSMRGITSVENLQTLCKECNKRKGINEINFKDIFKSNLNQSKDIVYMDKAGRESPQCSLIRTINFFYHCKAVSDIKFHIRRSGKYYSEWVIELFEGNNIEWLMKHENELLSYVQNELGCPQVKNLSVISVG
ncbi:DEAD/DEAH box helicase [Acetobacterium fimetarium]|uniref:DEAD/DEAH box helicase n=1 Tax=Acetobacterium fimetarium TaxID=52691 RepID=A0ABR6WQQ1_9FIRM|nr:DEAD/DEAH box helicase [Acetobacterium fimetarium]MBC3802954.1 DEAD/DEAH box helicase [Acetobacterium fimetarium]